MKKTLQDMFEYMSHEKNWPQSVWMMVYFSLSFIIIGFVLAWVCDKFTRIKKPKAEAFDDLGFTWKNGRFEKMKKVK